MLSSNLNETVIRFSKHGQWFGEQERPSCYRGVRSFNKKASPKNAPHLKSTPAHMEMTKFGGHPCQRKPQGDVCSVYLRRLKMQHSVYLRSLIVGARVMQQCKFRPGRSDPPRATAPRYCCSTRPGSCAHCTSSSAGFVRSPHPHYN